MTKKTAVLLLLAFAVGVLSGLVYSPPGPYQTLSVGPGEFEGQGWVVTNTRTGTTNYFEDTTLLGVKHFRKPK